MKITTPRIQANELEMYKNKKNCSTPLSEDTEMLLFDMLSYNNGTWFID